MGAGAAAAIVDFGSSCLRTQDPRRYALGWIEGTCEAPSYRSAYWTGRLRLLWGWRHPVQSTWRLEGAALLAVSIAQPAWGQGLLHYLQDPDPDRSLGPSVARIGDVDLDGTEDFAISGLVLSTNVQFARVCSGSDASTLFEIPPFLPGTFVVGYPLRLAGLGDVDGDGVPDLAIGDPGAQQNGVVLGSVSLHSGVDGSVLQVFWGQKNLDLFGYAIAGAGDVDGD